ncbi:type II secretion system protein GspD [Victivallis lenta]|uniref:type II secretion system protein GspD n=1 Tax=Victivallis lenta TaxID=2606640 RepID=UPI003AB3CE79
MNVQIGKETEQITFVNTNNDPYVYTKVYKLKHADPYEIRPYVMAAIRSRRVDTSVTKVEAVKYQDGTGMLLVSAEEYRFFPVENGMSLDQIIEMLDRPNLASEAGRRFFLYYPKYFDSVTLAGLIRKVGMQHAGDNAELQGGIDTVVPDTKLNTLMFYASPNSEPQILKMLKEYDTPTSQALVNYTIYEIESENDGNLGVDFQAWKNGPGADLFAAGSRYLNGWNLRTGNISNLVKSAHVSYINFNPKWNSRYLDFLVSKGKAKVVTSGSLNIGNGTTASIESVTRMPVIVAGEETAGGETQIAKSYIATAVNPADTLSGLGVDQEKFQTVEWVPGNAAAQFTATRTIVNGKAYDTLRISSGHFTAGGRNLGDTCAVFNAEPTLNDTAIAWTEAGGYPIEKDKTRVTNSDTEYGFSLTMQPYIYNKATCLALEMSNTNLIGFRSNGMPRTSRTELKTEVQLANDGNVFYIGGLDKSAVVRSVSKVPFLGDIPFLGFLFSAENETLKKTQLAAVLTVIPTSPTAALPENYKQAADKIGEKVKNFGVRTKYYEENDYGFDQLGLDPEKKY